MEASMVDTARKRATEREASFLTVNIYADSAVNTKRRAILIFRSVRYCIAFSNLLPVFTRISDIIHFRRSRRINKKIGGAGTGFPPLPINSYLSEN
jgi:hypothetical protein